MPSCESPARRMTASLIDSGLRSARPEAGLAAAEAPFGALDSGEIGGGFTWCTQYQKHGANPLEKISGDELKDLRRRKTSKPPPPKQLPRLISRAWIAQSRLPSRSAAKAGARLRSSECAGKPNAQRRTPNIQYRIPEDSVKWPNGELKSERGDRAETFGGHRPPLQKDHPSERNRPVT